MSRWKKDIIHSCYGCPMYYSDRKKIGTIISIVVATITNATISVMVANLMLEFIRRKQMSRYIDAEVMREDWLENGENEYVYDTNAVLDSIDNQPIADVVEVVHGEWESYPSILYRRCSVCKTEYYTEWNRYKGKYCPKCGAKMDGKKVE